MDIETETISMDDLTKKLEQLQTLLGLQRGWISLVSHNFKGTFSNIVMLIDAYEAGSINCTDFMALLPQLKEDAERNLKLISEASIWLKSIDDDFVPEFESIALEDLYLHLKTEFQSRLVEKDLELKFTDGKDIVVISDRFLLTSILVRLVDNAVKYSSPSQTIEISGGKTNQGVRITVSDQGSGMNENQLNNIFSFDGPVYQGSQGELGLGLGLKIVQSFISLLGAKIEFVSSKNEGTEVYIYLPLGKI